MNLVFDSIKDKINLLDGAKKIDKSFLLKQKSSLNFLCNVNFCNKVKIIVYAKSISGSGSVLVEVAGERRRVDFVSRKMKEYPILFETKSLDNSNTISLKYTGRIGKCLIERIIIYSEFKESMLEKSIMSSDNNNYGVKIGFIVPYSIYGGAEVYLKNILEKNYYDNYKLICLGQNKISSFLNKKNLINCNLLNLKKVLDFENFDIICFYNSKKVYDIMSTYRSNNSVKVVEIYHSDLIWGDSTSSFTNHNVDLIIRISKSVGNHIVGIKEKSCLVEPSIDFNKFKPKKLNKNLIGTVARLSDEKNLEYLISLNKTIKNKKFVVYGEGSKDIELMLKKNGIEVCGFKEDIENFYNFGAFILPSNTEGLPMTIIEAMANNIPCFAKDVGGISSILDNMDYNWKLTGNPEKDSENILYQIEKSFSFRDKIKNRFSSEFSAKKFFDKIIYSSESNKIWHSKVNPNDFFDEIYCINLDSRKDKWKKCMFRFSRWGINVKRYSAKGPTNPDVNYHWKRLHCLEPSESIRRSKKMMTKVGEVGCYLSHLDIIMTAKKEGKKKILIFEDDIIFHKDFDKKFNFIKIIPDWAMIYLGASQYNWNGVMPHSNKFLYSKNCDGTFAYAINLEYYDNIIAELIKITCPIDWHLRVGVQNVLKDKCFTFFPNIVIADTSDSDIRGGRNLSNHSKLMKWDLLNYEI